MTGRIAGAAAKNVVENWPGVEPPVVWRTWVVAGHVVPHGGPVLTGLGGFAWPGRVLDARCTDDAPALWREVERFGSHHRVIPDPSCTCGIYAVRDGLGTSRRPPSAVPTVSGFVELSGRILIDGDRYRAQRATITGPLVFDAPRPPWWRRLVGEPGQPRRVVPDGPGFHLSWNERARGEPYPDWLDRVGGILALRYAVPVLPPPGRNDKIVLRAISARKTPPAGLSATQTVDPDTGDCRE